MAFCSQAPELSFDVDMWPTSCDINGGAAPVRRHYADLIKCGLSAGWGQ